MRDFIEGVLITFSILVAAIVVGVESERSGSPAKSLTVIEIARYQKDRELNIYYVKGGSQFQSFSIIDSVGKFNVGDTLLLNKK